MPNTKKLLSITNLKKYFPVAKSSIFQKNKLYVRANEDITIDIYEGETLGIVGESGCGKSTLGRVLLQLYPQTAGCTLYYGITLDELTPNYVRDTIRNEKKYRARLKKAEERAEELQKKVDAAGGEDGADFYLLQECNIAKCEVQTHESNIVKILGGFFAKDDPEGMRLLNAIYEENKKRNRLVDRRKPQKVEVEHLENEATLVKGAKADVLKKRIALAKARMQRTDDAIADVERSIAALNQKLEAVKAKYPDIIIVSTAGSAADGPEFNANMHEIDEKYQNTVVDEHYYRNNQWFYTNGDRYHADKVRGADGLTYDRNRPTRVFVGEFANNNSNNDYASAMAEAAYWTSLERNSDMVVMAAYAPLLCKKGYNKWNIDP